MSKIIGTGMYVPLNVVTNDDISEHNDWIVENIGIKERRVIGINSDIMRLSVIAANNAMAQAGIKTTDEIDMLIVATSSGNHIAPSLSCLVKRDMKLHNAIAFDINAVCSGFLFAWSIAEQYFKSTGQMRILIIGVDTFSKITDYSDRNCVFFGDGAGAVVLSGFDNLKAIRIYSDIDTGGFSCENGGTFKMDSKEVYRKALELVPKAIYEVLEQSHLTIDDIDYMIPHQPSKRILNDIADEIGLPREKVLMNMDRYANTAAASIPILLYESWHKFKKGDKLLFASIGSGWTYGAAIYEV
jgi:3-oxoacyl-[acyl-carrier-protein] synthase III